MEFYDEKIKQLAIEIYELDAEVYEKVGSSLGRVFTAERDICIRNIMEDLHSRQKSSHVRSELALISNMARTIKDKNIRHLPSPLRNCSLRSMHHLLRAGKPY